MGYRSTKLPDDVYLEVQEVRKYLVLNGTDVLPMSWDVGDISGLGLGVVVGLGMRALRERIGAKTKVVRSKRKAKS